jgi:hypothetical protein
MNKKQMYKIYNKRNGYLNFGDVVKITNYNSNLDAYQIEGSTVWDSK